MTGKGRLIGSQWASSYENFWIHHLNRADQAILKRGVPNPGQKGGVPISCPHSNALIVQKKGGFQPRKPPPPLYLRLGNELQNKI